MVHTGASTMGSIMEPKESQVRESRCINGPQCEANKYWQIVFWYCLVNVTLVNGEYYDSNFHPLGPEAFALPCKLLMHGFLHSFGDNLNCMGDVNPMSPQAELQLCKVPADYVPVYHWMVVLVPIEGGLAPHNIE